MGAQSTIPLDIPDVRVLHVPINNHGDWTITVESTIQGTQCRQCRREITYFHRVDDWITLRHLPVVPPKNLIQPKQYNKVILRGGNALDRSNALQRAHQWIIKGASSSQATLPNKDSIPCEDNRSTPVSYYAISRRYW